MGKVKVLVPLDIPNFNIIPLGNSISIESCYSPEERDYDHLISWVVGKCLIAERESFLDSVISAEEILEPRERVDFRRIVGRNSSPYNSKHKEYYCSFLDEVIESFVKEPFNASLTIDVFHSSVECVKGFPVDFVLFLKVLLSCSYFQRFFRLFAVKALYLKILPSL